jgi:ubiquinone/menaquinone biosynthesis C-methylase UbiE
MVDYVEDLYRARFTRRELGDKIRVWKILTRYFFQRYVKKDDTVLDVGAGYCEFINSIRAKRKIAVDINKDIYKFAARDVEIVLNDCKRLSDVPGSSVDVVFISNILEHLDGAHEIEMALLEAKRVLKKGGILMVMQPNIKYAYREYWDFFDHVVPLSHKGTAEALLKNGYDIVEVRPRFLPYSSKQAVPKWPFLIRLYLNLRFMQNIFGKQMFIVARKPMDSINKRGLR